MTQRQPTHPPQVGAAMTAFPYFVSSDDSIDRVERLMRDHDIRHVPVQDDGHLVGIITERDLHRLVNPALPRLDKARIRARAVLLPDPFVVDVDTPLSHVVAEMARRRLGSALVVKHGKLVGILSVTDVCRFLAALLEAVFPSNPGGGDEAA